MLRLNNSLRFITIAIFLLSVCYLISRYIYFNPSASEAIGYYLVYQPSNYKRNDLVLICLNKNIWVEKAHKLGLPYDSTCTSNTPYLLKQIVGIPGDTVGFNLAGVSINGRYFKDSMSIGSYKGVLLNPYRADSLLHLGDRQYFLLGQGRLSYDSRYFGAIDKKDIHYKAIHLKFVPEVFRFWMSNAVVEGGVK